MWDIEECKIRISNNHIFFIFLKKGLPIGHVWYDSNYLYNAYVSNERVDGESAWFIIETIKTIINNKIPNIKLHTETWNIRAQKFWEKIGFVVI